jgi:hypothetical protein
MKTLITIVITLQVFSILSGQVGEKINNRIKTIDLLAHPDAATNNLSDIATDVQYIQLQTSESSLVGRTADFKIYGGITYINTRTELICFDKTGRYLYKLNKIGRGPGEYSFIEDYDINSKGDILILRSHENIFVYDIKGNEFVFNKLLNIKSAITNKISNIDFVPGQNNVLLSYECFGEEPFRNIVINLDGNTLNARPNYYKFTNRIQIMGASPDENINYDFNNSIYFKEWESDTVFTLDQTNKIIPYLILNANGKQPTPDDFVKYLNLDISKMMTSSPISQNLIIRIVMEVPRYIIYGFRYLNKEYFEIYDKVLNKKFGIDPRTFFKDDISGGINFEPKFSGDGRLFSLVEALALKNYFSGDSFKNSVVKNPEKKKALEKLADSLNETDNPVLIVVTPKK